MDKYPPYDANLEISQFYFSRSSKVIGVVDDSSIVRKSIKIDLEAAGYGTTLAGSGKKALEMLGHKPDLILLD